MIDDPSLDREQKIELLCRWEYDAREREVAEDENMGGGPPDRLDEILAALGKQDAGIDVEHDAFARHEEGKMLLRDAITQAESP